MTNNTLSFSELEKRIRAIPDGPSSALNTPLWILAWNVFGTLGIILGLLPSLLIKLIDPQMWMVDMARGGLWLAAIGYLPGFVRGIWVVASSMWRWKDVQPAQLDHDLSEFRKLRLELAQQPTAVLSEHLRFTQHVQARLAAKLGFLAGGLDKLGILPIVVSIGLQLKSYGDPASIPMWQVIAGLFFAVTYLVAMIGSLMRIRMQLYETVLAEALIEQSSELQEEQ